MATIPLKTQNDAVKKDIERRRLNDPGAYLDLHSNYRGDTWLTVFPGYSGHGDYPASAVVQLGAAELKTLQDRIYELRVQAEVKEQVAKKKAAVFDF